MVKKQQRKKGNIDHTIPSRSAEEGGEQGGKGNIVMHVIVRACQILYLFVSGDRAR